ncbi:MAG: Ig-like domain-containing protein [bacterium]
MKMMQLIKTAQRAAMRAALAAAAVGFGLAMPADVQAAANFYDFSTDPNLAGAWTNRAFYVSTGTATWSTPNQNLNLAGGSGDRWSVLRPTAETRGATDPVELTINSASATGTDWAMVGLVISADTAPTLTGTSPIYYQFVLATDNANVGNWSYRVKRAGNVSLYSSAVIPFASLTFPIRLDIVRRGAYYDFKVNDTTVYTASYYTSAQHDTMVYSHITWGDGTLTTMASTVDNFGTDTTPPTVSTLSPADNATGVALGSNLVVTFSEAIAIGTGNITITNLTDATQTAIAITSGSPQVTVSGSQLTINPTTDLVAGRDYAILIAATAVKDIAGNLFAGISDETTWNFTTTNSDTIPPAISSLSPANSATNVPTVNNLVVTFSEAISIGTGNITLKNLTDATQTTIDITSGSQVSVAGAVLTINPTADLTAGKSYAIRIDATAITDKSGNFFVGIADDATWNFTTWTWTLVKFDNFASDPNISTQWANQVYYKGVGTATWNPGTQDLGLAGGSDDRWSIMRRLNTSTRGATDPVELTINSASATGTDWAVVGLVISAGTAPTLTNTSPIYYQFVLGTDNANVGNWSYRVKRGGNVSLYSSTNIPFANLTFPIRLDIVRSGAYYDFKVNGTTVYTASYYTFAQHNTMVYSHITWGDGTLATMASTVDNFGIAPPPSPRGTMVRFF